MNADWLAIFLAAISGGALTECIRRILPAKEVMLDLQLKREAEAADTESNLRKALWEEIERLTRKVAILETHLEQASSVMSALKAENVVLKAELELVSKKIGLDFKTINGGDKNAT